MFTLHDQHCHSSYSEDSKEDINNYINIARSQGCKYFITTEHCDLHIAGENRDWIADYWNLNNYLKNKQNDFKDIKFLLGIEIGYKPSEKARIDAILSSLEFDLINLSIHDFDDVDLYFTKYYHKYGVEYLLNKYFDVMLEAINSDFDFDVLSHIDYAFRPAHECCNNIKMSDYEDKIIKVFKALIDKDKVLEINTKVEEMINDDNHVNYILGLYKECGGSLISLSSDAHNKERYLSSFNKYREMIKEAGFDNLCYFVKRKRYLYEI